ncbi:peritrophin-48 [Drosophila hydei]|uniref:Peritrophin-48 n=1 Tax=Drosophila hydei TaxID=7224 RepID=A0A6J1M2C5_DROHY|nr:peritrophin-48 [Drosophila hydei]
MKSYQLQLSVVLLLRLAVIRANTLSEIESLCRNVSTWTLVPDKRHCDRFYVCTGIKDRSYQEFRCPEEYHFNSLEKRCVRGSCAATCKTIGVQRLDGDCTRFKHCSNRGELSIAKCSYGLYFDAKRKACLPVNITPEHQCSCIMPEHSTLANSNDCRSYYRCEQGQAMLQQCPHNYYYDVTINSCLLDTRGECQPAVQLVQRPLQECQREGSRLVPHSTDCSRYYVCIGSQAIELRCPQGQYFDVVSRYCTDDKHYQCFGVTTSTTTKPATPNTTQNVNNSNQIHKVNSSKQADQLNENRPKPEDMTNSKLSSKFLLL